MLFSAPEFLYLFLPIVLSVWWRLQSRGQAEAAQWWVVAASVFFYGWWNWTFIPILAASVLINYRLGRHLASSPSRMKLAAGLAFNLGLLGYFKYANFLGENLASLAGKPWTPWDIVLPLGISFFTFQKIAFLVDCHQGHVDRFNFRRFAFFVAFFPQLIAGPIVHHAELISQIEGRSRYDAKCFGQGLMLFFLGLFKKTVIADRIAEQIDPLFAASPPLQLIEAWTAAVGYGLQLYFDFSGYSEMAIGMGMLFGLKLPQNFNSPYQAVNITDFWRRWHITLSRFLRDYLYIPLGGNRYGLIRGILAGLATFVLGGLWHGAAWTYVAWGAMHGLYIALHRAWMATGLKLPRLPAMILTWLAVTFAWVLFKAGSIGQAVSLWKGMLGLNGTTLPSAFRALCDDCRGYTSLANGLELCFFIILLVVCMESANAMERVSNLQPRKRELLLLYSTCLGCLFMAAGKQSFIYWQF